MIPVTDLEGLLFLDIDPLPRPHSHRHRERPRRLHPLRRPVPRPRPAHPPHGRALRPYRPVPHILRAGRRRGGSAGPGRRVRPAGRDLRRLGGRGAGCVARGCADSAGLGSGVAEVARHHRHRHVRRACPRCARGRVAALWEAHGRFGPGGGGRVRHAVMASTSLSQHTAS